MEERVVGRGIPFLGICVGMQMMAELGREEHVTRGFGWIGGEVCRIKPDSAETKIPHVGWNDLKLRREHPVLAGIGTGTHVYFTHSFQFVTTRPEDVAATVDHGTELTAAVAKGNLFGTQFHPEKSQAAGLRLIGNFLRWRP
jgi:glutamine amidotransferase